MVTQVPECLDALHPAIAVFCQRWKIAKLEVFGSIARGDFAPKSDVDVMVTFAADSHPGLDFFSSMPDELSAIFGREVDLVTRQSVERSRNELRRNGVLSGAHTIYESRR